MEASQAEFWTTLGERLETLTELEGAICANLMQESASFEEEVPEALEALVFHVTTQFPVSDQPGHSEEDASTVIELAHAVSEKFMAFFQASQSMSAEDFRQVSMLRKGLKGAMEMLSDIIEEPLRISRGALSLKRSPTRTSTTSLSASNSSKNTPVITKKLPPLPNVAGRQMAQQSGLPRQSIGDYSEEDAKDSASRSSGATAAAPPVGRTLDKTRAKASGGRFTVTSDGEEPRTSVDKARSAFAAGARSTSPGSLERQAPAGPTPARQTWMSPVLQRDSGLAAAKSSGNMSLPPQKAVQVIESVSVAPRFYHCSSFDRAHNRILLHGGLRRDKPSRLCVPNVYSLEVGSGGDSSTGDSVWTLLETTGGPNAPALCWHSAVFLDSATWMIFGGKSSNNQMSNMAYTLDTVKLIWTPMKLDSPPPEPRGGHTMLPMPSGTHFVLFGGMDSTGSKCFNDVYIFNRTTKKWHIQMTSDPPVGRFVHAACILGRYMVVMGGLKGSLSKSTPCGDVWLLNLDTWEWLQPKQNGPMPEPGTYSCTPLDGDQGSSALFIGSKAFDDTRALYHVLKLDSATDAKSVTWIRDTLSVAYKPSVSEGHSCFMAGKSLYIIGGRPGLSESNAIDMLTIPRDIFPQELSRTSGNMAITSPDALSNRVKKKNKKRLSQSSSAVQARKKDALKRGSSTVGPRSGKRFTESASDLHGSANYPMSDDDSPLQAGSPPNAVASPLHSPRGGGGEEVARLTKQLEALKETVGSLQANFESELSLRLDAESKVQTFSNSTRSIQEAYNVLQRETARFYELAMSEVSSPSSKEKLERRYEELRSAAADALSSGGDGGAERQVRLKSEKSNLFQLVQGGKKDKLMEHHLSCVDRVNFEVNKLYRPSMKDMPPARLDVDAIVSPRGDNAGTADSDQSDHPESGALKRSATLAAPHQNTNSSETASSDNRTAAEEEVLRVRQFSFSAFPADIKGLWKAADLANEFCLFTTQMFPDVTPSALFCRAVQRIIFSAEDTREALVESLVIEHIMDDSEFLVEALDQSFRDEILDNCDGAWLEEPPADEYWEELMRIVEESLLEAFEAYRKAIETKEVRPRASMLLTTSKARSGHHQILASAETQLMERLKEMGTEEEESASEESEKEEYLFKKVTTEMVATEINYVTDLKVTTTIFRRPLMSEKSSILPLEAFNIFGNIEDVYTLNRKFLTVLQKEHGKPLASKNYGKVFLEFAQQFQKVYLTYAGRKTISRNTLDELSVTNKKFIAFLEECLQKPPCRRLELKSFLIKPVQRICKYPLLLRTMVENMPKAYQFKGSLMEAKQAMEEVVLALEDQLFVEDDKMKILELEGALNWHREPKLVLAVEGRSMIEDSIMVGTEIPVGANVNDALLKKMRNIHLYLMTDVLLLVEQVEKKGVRRDFLHHVVSIPYSVVVPVTGKAAFQIVAPQQDNFKYVFRCGSMDQKLHWVRMLTDAIHASRSNISTIEEP